LTERGLARDLAARLARLSARTEDEQALLGFALGAAYSIDRATQLGAPADFVVAEYGGELQSAAQAVADGDEPPSGWFRNYYLNSAVQRLDALHERLGKFRGVRSLGGKHWRPAKYEAERIGDDVKQMKHDLGSFLKQGRRATLRDAERVLERVVAGLELLVGDVAPASGGRRTSA
jgi:hypothetical protein